RESILAQTAQHLEGHLVCQQLLVLQGLEEDREPTLGILGGELLPARIPPLLLRGTRPGRGLGKGNGRRWPRRDRRNKTVLGRRRNGTEDRLTAVGGLLVLVQAALLVLLAAAARAGVVASSLHGRFS